MDTPGKTNTLTKPLKSENLPVTAASDNFDSGLIDKGQKLNQGSTSYWKAFDLNMFSGGDRKEWYSKIHNLLLNINEISDLFNFALHHQSWLNAFLLAAGMSQIVEDYLSDTGLIGKVNNVVKLLPRPFSTALSAISNRSLSIWQNLRRTTPIQQKIILWEKRVNQLIGELAEVVISAAQPEVGTADRLIGEGENIFSEVIHLPKNLRSEIIRLPSSFLSFDQQIEDLQGIIGQFSMKWPERGRLISVVGIRTSGSYLGPLYSAILNAQGYNNVTLETIRPGKTVGRTSSMRFNQLAEENGLTLVCDDPPISGATISKTIKILEEAGISSSNIIVLLQLFGDSSSVPTSLGKYPAIILPKQEWNIQQYLLPDHVRQVLSEVCSDSVSISGVEQVPYESMEEDRQHVHAQYRVDLIDGKSGEITSRIVRVKGIGLGYYAEHALAVSQVLSSYSARIITVQNGLIYLDLGSDAKALSPDQLVEDSRWVEAIIRYVLERNRKMSMSEDVSMRIYGRNAVWEVASNILATVFGANWWMARLVFIDRFVKEVLLPAMPSVIDGDIGPSNWYIEKSADQRLIKDHLAERDFSHKDLFSYDPAFDLASLAYEIDDDHQANRIRQSFETQADEGITNERWMLYRLVRLWDINRQNGTPSSAVSSKMERVVQEYYSDIYFSDLRQSPDGPICALDIDGVLETNQLGFASLTKSSAKSLRALGKHGYRVVLATGRSLNQVKSRCETYHLAGGVAEYGSVIYDALSNVEFPLLTDEEQLVLAQLRISLAKVQGVWIDTDYHYSIRAFSLDRFGKRIGLSEETISMILAVAESINRISVVKGNAQTDFVVSRVNKAVGIVQWLSKFNHAHSIGQNGARENNPLELAVGDTTSDVQMLKMAAHAFAPGHAELGGSVAGVHITQKPYQRGFEQAITEFLGHKPGTCPICMRLTLQPQTKFMLDLLSVQEDGLANMVRQAIILSLRKARRLNGGSY